jgi:hypothetical protein
VKSCFPHIALVLAGALAGCAMPGASGIDSGVALDRKSDNATLYVLNRLINAPTVTVYSGGGKTLLRTLQLGETGHFSRSAYELAASQSGLLYNLSPSKPKDTNGPGILNIYRDKGAKLISSVNLAKHYGRLALDKGGNVYTVCANRTICEYESNGKLLRQINTTNTLGRVEPIALAVDNSGNLAVLSDSVFVYPPGSNKPSWKIKFEQGTETSSEAFDPSGNLYISDFGNHVREYAPNTTTPVRVITEGVSVPTEVLCDSSSNLYVLNEFSVTVYAPQATTPSATVSAGISGPTAMAFDRDNDLYVSNEGSRDSSSVTVYAAGTLSLMRTVTNGVEGPTSIGVGP